MKRQSGMYLMKRLIIELKPLIFIMCLTILLGVLGYLAAIAIAAFATFALGAVLEGATRVSFNTAVIIMIVCAVSRGLLRYGEQLSGHYIAFKLLHLLRDKTFRKLRTLAPAKLEGKDKGNLISLITSDIELLEVFYAHTVAPVAIAVLTNSMISILLYQIHPAYGIVSAGYFILVGAVIPYVSSVMVKEAGIRYRDAFAASNQFVLDSLRGLKEILLFNQGPERLKNLERQSQRLNDHVRKIKNDEGLFGGITNLVITSAMLTFTGMGVYFYSTGTLPLTLVLVALVVIASSFGPVVALSSLPNTLTHTFACAERLFHLLDEKPQVDEVEGNADIAMEDIRFNNVSFTYPKSEEPIFSQTAVSIEKGEKVALIGESGIGKSTFIKLFMRYFDVDHGEVLIDKQSIKEIPTASLRRKQTLVSQETYLFNDTILNNIKLGKPDASLEEIIAVAKKAAIHEFIVSLPKGYETKTGELGDKLSSGERQRLGLARAFLHNGEVLILDEPTSNLDVLNEGAILTSINDNHLNKTVIMVSHRKSTTSICSRNYQLKNQQLLPQEE
ncbi:ATP-binding cassette, subfamily C [Evansella caseinilytica]|uniref:ATP-binding cassette, subfamily C n=1 Tax=Evansella caseinilytica TaxID=1503961 RepID=A0A1H3QXF6_9BACI|nr:ABC transporter ATP-binding protein [Evansella caseinilytica]SDZ17725.1 ATP-binding cassette, subfamily C [Evansella caseinilytica]